MLLYKKKQNKSLRDWTGYYENSIIQWLLDNLNIENPCIGDCATVKRRLEFFENSFYYLLLRDFQEMKNEEKKK